MLRGTIGQEHLGVGDPIGDGCCDKAQRFHGSHHGGAGLRYLCEQKNSAKSSAKKRIFM
ncbi:hypothetical protein NUBL17186_18430 [Klebsiella quasipneumoniae]|nr:hypothetical protein TUM17554_10470 [Klebsiella pneumoniae]GKO82915.1 hypothetical protein NUBL17186_18430 [Klebsiella quasipneumoniae]GKP40885.1 hypothetical protein NUKP28_45070 [Klebsiella quasipneumoniae]GLV18857.1 hypothetical protein KML001_38440 [Klebsiella quasipneumoniae subsp. similipneumoniae]GLZ95130.1 hypothetical protein KML002_03990 [Klebsiella quasipneumoniae subsp. similipneumoniae]